MMIKKMENAFIMIREYKRLLMHTFIIYYTLQNNFFHQLPLTFPKIKNSISHD